MLKQIRTVVLKWAVKSSNDELSLASKACTDELCLLIDILARETGGDRAKATWLATIAVAEISTDIKEYGYPIIADLVNTYYLRMRNKNEN